MAIYEPIIEIICDTCGASEEIQPEYKYTDYSGNTGYYDCDDKSIEKIVVDQYDWIVEDGNHYCCEDCQENRIV